MIRDDLGDLVGGFGGGRVSGYWLICEVSTAIVEVIVLQLSAILAVVPQAIIITVCFCGGTTTVMRLCMSLVSSGRV